MIEEKIDQLIAALNANTAALAGSAAKPPKAEKPKTEEKKSETAKVEEKKPDAPVGPTMTDLRALAQQLVDAGRVSDVKDANKALGFAKVSECPPDKFTELHTKLKAAVDALGAV